MRVAQADQSRDRGAILVVTAIAVVAIVAFAAFAVDLGNTFTRKRLLQTQADLAALAGAGSLPDADAAIAAARTYLQNNEVVGDQDWDEAKITVSSDNLRIRVETPPATVNFGFASVIGQDSTDVTAVAEAGIFSPGALAPFFIAEGCLTQGGSRLEIKTDPGNVTPTPINPAFFPTPDPPVNNTWPSLNGAPTPFELLPASEDPGAQTVTLRGDNLDQIVEIGLVWGEANTDRISVTDTDEFTITPGVKKNDPDLIELTVPDEAVTLPDAPFAQTRVIFFQVRPSTSEVNFSLPVAESSVIVSDPGADIPDECGEKSTGDFGLIDSPRAGAKNMDATQRNVALGLDHAVYTYPGGSTAIQTQGIPPGQTEDAKWNDICVKYTASPPFVLDVDGAVEPNCFEIYTGNKVTVLDKGLIEGGTSPDYDGRLVADQSAACDSRPQRTVTLNKAWTINDDLLSCFIMDGKKVSDVLKPNPSQLLEGSIVDSPRFLIVPIIYADYPPANGSYPIVDYVGAMIAADKITSTKSSPQTEPDNGLIISNKKIGSMTVTYFRLGALPETVNSTGAVIDYIGQGPRVLRLIE